MALTRSPSLRFLINILFLQSFSCNCLYNLKPRDPHIQGREQGLAIGNWWPKFLQDHIWWWDLEYSYVWQCAMTNVWSCERMRGFFRVDQLTAAGETQEKQLWQIFSTLWSTNYYRQEHVIFFDGLFGFFFISRFYSMSGKVSVSAALPLSYLFQTGALETRIVNCTVFSQTHAECTKNEWTISCQTWITTNDPVCFSGEDFGSSYEKRFSLALELEGREVQRDKRIFKILTIDLPAGSGTWLLFSHQITLGCHLVT